MIAALSMLVCFTGLLCLLVIKMINGATLGLTPPKEPFTAFMFAIIGSTILHLLSFRDKPLSKRLVIRLASCLGFVALLFGIVLVLLSPSIVVLLEVFGFGFMGLNALHESLLSVGSNPLHLTMKPKSN